MTKFQVQTAMQNQAVTITVSDCLDIINITGRNNFVSFKFKIFDYSNDQKDKKNIYYLKS